MVTTIQLDESIKAKLSQDVRARKIKREDTEAYIIEEIKGSREHEKFIRGFLERLDKNK